MKKYWQYLKYVLRHKWFVFLAGLKLGVPIVRLILHDWTKFLPSEWFPYAFYFYGSYEAKQKKNTDLHFEYHLSELVPYGEHFDDKFEIAWNHHQKRNDHHWQYWLLTEDTGKTYSMPMSKAARAEMLADWMGAGRALGNPDTAGWYLKNKSNIRLRQEDRAWVEKQLGIC